MVTDPTTGSTSVVSSDGEGEGEEVENVKDGKGTVLEHKLKGVQATPDGATTKEAGFKLHDELAIKAYNRLKEESDKVGPVTNLVGVGSRVAPVTFPGMAKGKRFELNYDKPDGALVITRSFLPVEEKKVKLFAEAHVTAPRPDSRAYKEDYPKQVKEMTALVASLRKIVITAVKSAVSMILTTELSKLGFFSKKLKRNCTTTTEVFQAWQSQEPELSFCENLYKLYYSAWEDKKEQVAYEVMMKLGLWLSTTEEAQNDKKVSCLVSLVGLVLRQYRNKFSRGERLSHGITLTISVRGGGRQKQNMPRRKKEDGFVPEIMVLGWNGEKHQKFLAALSVAPPVSLQKAIAEWKASKNTAEMAYLPHGKVRFLALGSCNVTH